MSGSLLWGLKETYHEHSSLNARGEAQQTRKVYTPRSSPHLVLPISLIFSGYSDSSYW